MVDSTAVSNNFVIQNLLQRADQITQQAFGPNSTITVLGENQYASTNAVGSSNQNNLRIEEVDEATANQILQSLASVNAFQEYQVDEAENSANSFAEVPQPSSPAPVAASTVFSNAGELYQDPNPPQVIRRPPAQGPVTYQQKVSVRYLQPPPLPPPGPLIIKEVRPPQPPAPVPLVIRQRAPPLPIPPPLVLRERPPVGPPPVPSQTVIKKLPAVPVPPRSVIVERFPALPPRPRDVVIERWLPYSKEPQKRKVVTYRAPPPRPYPAPRNTVVIYEPVQANVVRVVQRLGVQPQNPQEYVLRYGGSLLDSASLVTQVQNVGINEDISPPFFGLQQQHQQQQQQSQAEVAEYYLDTTQSVVEPQYEYVTATTVESEAANNNEQVQVYWTDPYEDVRAILQRLNLSTE